MKTVILAGGYGTRFGKLTDFLPKPMIPVGPFPMIWHIMRSYASYGHDDFVICTGYKSELIKEYFCNLQIYSSDFTLDFKKSATPKPEFNSEAAEFRPRVALAYTGQDTMTGGRLSRVRKYLQEEDAFMLTYGDGVSNVDIKDLIAFHKSHGKLATLTAVYPPPKFGDLKTDGDRIISFSEKSGKQGAMVNGGFYIFQREVLDYVSDDQSCILEREPMERLAQAGELMSYRHEGYWQCMDTMRDLEGLQSEWNSGKAAWKNWGSDAYCD